MKKNIYWNSVYHIICHNIESVLPELKKFPDEIKDLDHAVNKYIRYCKQIDSSIEHKLVVLSKYTKNNYTLTHKDGYLIYVMKIKHILFNIEYSPDLKKFIKKIDNKSIVHVHWISSFLFDYIAPSLKNKRSIAHYRWWHFTRKAFPISFLKYTILAYFTLKMPKLLFIENQSTIRKYEKYYRINRNNMVFIPSVLDINDVYRYKKDYTLWEKLNLIFAGRLVPAKWIIELLDTVKKINKESNYKINLKIAWDWPLFNMIKGKFVDNDIILLWHINYKTLITEYCNSDLFILPTHYESFGLVIIEAMACWLPVITTKTNGPSMIVKNWETWFIINVNDKRRLESKILFFLNNPSKLKSFWVKWRSVVLDKFTVQKIFPKIIDIYRNILRDEI